MMTIDKMDAFIIVARALRNGDHENVKKMNKIISNSMKADRQSNSYSQLIEIDSATDKIFNQYLCSTCKFRYK